MGKHWCWIFISGDEIRSFPSFLQLKDKERQMIKERFKVRRCWMVSEHPLVDWDTQICLRRRPLGDQQGREGPQTVEM